MHEVIQQLVARGPVVTDGAWGTELQVRGLPIGEFPDAWNLTRPESVAELAQAARIIEDSSSRLIRVHKPFFLFIYTSPS